MQIKKEIKNIVSTSKTYDVLRKVKAKVQKYKSRISPKGMDAIRLSYAGYYDKCPVFKNIILYEAYAGRGLLCSPYAIFKMFSKRSDFRDYTHVWVLENEAKAEEAAKEWKQENIIFVVRDSEQYLEYLCKAGVLINNLSFPPYYTKKPEQLYINTWHGIPLKTLGFDIPDGRITGLNTIRNFLSVDVFLSPNRFMTDIFKNAFRLDGIFEGGIMESGMPRNDNLFHTDKKEIIKKLRKYGVEVDDTKKIIMYAPTWKGEKYSNPDISTESYFELIDKLEQVVDTDRYQMLVKPHQIVYKHIVENGKVLTDKFIPADIDANEIMSIVDVLISDYSSIYFDFLASLRPVIFYIPDLEEYLENRGLYFGIDKLPGPIAKNLDELGKMCADIDTAVAPYKEKYDIEKNWACGNDDGNVCSRVIDKLIVKRDFSGLIRCDVTSKKRIIAYSGNPNNESEKKRVEDFIKKLDYDKYDLTLIVPHIATDNVLEWIRNIDPRVRVLRRIGKEAVVKTNYKYSDMLHAHDLSKENLSKEKQDIISDICSREMLRTTGQTHFECVYDFSDKPVYYKNIFTNCCKGKYYMPLN